MANPPRYPDTGKGPGVGSDRESTGGMPRWVKVVGVIVAVLVLLFVAVQLVGGGHQIPQHAPSLGVTSLVPALARHLR